ncbi:MAG: hypothetical protein GF346_13655 [Candidatus Eisenbacteria bacterium]|nr:hypothetical protein [Candidatus Latescibacterota bacterium]MBD3303486.1 hypothetical protein [Candidatus Eisenbacteria bacterium]
MKTTRRRAPRGRFAGLLAMTILVGIGGSGSVASAETITWSPAQSGTWNTLANWNPSDIPNEAGEEAVIPANDGSYSVTLDLDPTLDRVWVDNVDAILDLGGRTLTTLLSGGLENRGTVWVSGGSGLDGEITNHAGGALSVPTGTSLYLYASPVINDGEIAVNPTGGSTNAYLRIYSTDVQLDGTGEMVLATGGSPADASVVGHAANYVLTQGGDHTIRGEGEIGVTFVNEGLVLADVADRNLELSGNAKTNNGVLSATDAGRLVLRTAVAQGEDGELLADGGTILLASGGDLTGGSLSTINGGGIFRSGSGDLENVTNYGDFGLQSNTSTYLYGSALTNDGTITVNFDVSSQNTYLRVYATPYLLDGSGDLLLRYSAEPGDAQLVGYADGYELTQAAGHTIHGAGTVSVRLINEGLVSADRPGEDLRVDGSAKTNNATFQAVGDGRLVITTDVAQGPFGEIRADGGHVRFGSGSEISGGTLQTTGGGTMRRTGSGMLRDVTNLGDLELRSNTYTHLDGTALTNEGTITVNYDVNSTNAYLRVDATPYRLEGSGDLLLRTSAEPGDAQLNGYGDGYELTQAAGHTIHGAGTIGVRLVNEGLVSADRDGEDLVLSGSVKTNDALMKAENGGRLLIYADVLQTASGQILADGGRVRIDAADLSGGTFATTNGGTIHRIGTGSFSDITNLGEIGLRSGTSTTLEGSTLTNEGTIQLNVDEDSDNAYLRIDANPYTLQGAGELVMGTAGNPQDAQINSYGANYVLTQAAGHTIRGTGQINATLVNDGTVTADVDGATIEIDGNEKTNNALFLAENNGTLRIAAPVTQGENGRIRADGGQVQLSASGDITGGTLETANGGTMKRNGSADMTDVTNEGELRLLGGTATYLYGDHFTNNGTVRINSNASANNCYVRVDSNPMLLDGTGDVVLQTGGTFSDAQLNGYSADHVLTNGASHTIRGEGEVRVNLVNEGTVLADAPGEVLYLISNEKTNRGLLRAQDDGILDVSASLLNEGICEAADSGLFRASALGNHYSSGTLTGGTWRAFAASTVRLTGADIVENAATLVLDGIDSQFRSDNSGTDALAGFATNAEAGSFTIRNGRDFTTADSFENAGELVVGEGSTFTSTGPFTQTSGETRIDGTLSAPDPVDVQRGVLSGNGTVTANVSSAGAVAPGASVGLLTIDGDYEQLEDGLLRVELGGTAPEESDRLVVTGAATLAGRLEVQIADEFEVQAGDSFTILTCAERSGVFEEPFLGKCPSSGVCLDLVYDAGSVVLVAYGVDPADVEEWTEPADPEDLPQEIRFRADGRIGGSPALRLDLPADALVRIQVFDVAGRLVQTVRDGRESAGFHTYSMNRGRLGSGLYFARAQVRTHAGPYAKTVRLLLVR